MSNVVAISNMWDERLYVMGWCKRHGWREPSNWDADDFERESLKEAYKRSYGDG